MAKQTHSSEDAILDSWHRNALPWAEAIRDEKIESRRLVTNRAIVDAILDRSPRSVLDIGCGEGWLVRALSGHGMRVTGIDAVPALVEEARNSGGGEFHVATYDEWARRCIPSWPAEICRIRMAGDQVPGMVSVPGSAIRPRGTSGRWNPGRRSSCSMVSRHSRSGSHCIPPPASMPR